MRFRTDPSPEVDAARARVQDGRGLARAAELRDRDRLQRDRGLASSWKAFSEWASRAPVIAIELDRVDTRFAVLDEGQEALR